jgi:hypothetical protein
MFDVFCYPALMNKKIMWSCYNVLFMLFVFCFFFLHFFFPLFSPLYSLYLDPCVSICIRMYLPAINFFFSFYCLVCGVNLLCRIPFPSWDYSHFPIPLPTSESQPFFYLDFFVHFPFWPFFSQSFCSLYICCIFLPFSPTTCLPKFITTCITWLPLSFCFFCFLSAENPWRDWESQWNN